MVVGCVEMGQDVVVVEEVVVDWFVEQGWTA